MFRLQMSLATLLISAFTTSFVRADEENKPYYRVEAVFKTSGFKRSEPIDDIKYANEVREEWKFTHGPKGSNSSNPITMGPDIVRYYMGKTEVMKPAPIDPMKPVARPGVTTASLDLFKGLSDKKWVDVKPLTPTADTATSFKGTGLVEGAKVTIELKKNGEFVIDGEYAATGKWTLISKTLVLESLYVRFSGQIDGDSISGTFAKLDPMGKTEKTNGFTRQPKWSATFTTAKPLAPAATPTPTPTKPMTIEVKPVETKCYVMERKYYRSEGGWGPWMSVGGEQCRKDAEKLMNAEQERYQRAIRGLDPLDYYPKEWKIDETSIPLQKSSK